MKSNAHSMSPTGPHPTPLALAARHTLYPPDALRTPHLLFALGIACTMLAGCGGAGTDFDPGPDAGPDYVTWNGSANGVLIKDADNGNFAVEASSRAVVALDIDSRLSGLFVDQSAQVVNDGQVIGAVTPDISTGGSQIAVFSCSDGSRMKIVLASGGWSYQCGPATGTQTPGSGGGKTSSSGDPRLANWNGNDNGSTVLDVDNEHFAVSADSGEVVTRPDNRALRGTAVTDATLSFNGLPIAVVTLANGTNNTKVAVFQCPNGRLLDLQISADHWSYDCGDSGSGGSTGSGGTTGSGRTTSSDADGMNASSCLAVTTDEFGNSGFRNRCDATVHFSFCYRGSRSVLFECGPSAPLGDGQQSYSRGASQVGPGEFSLLPDFAGEVLFMGCAAGPSGRDPLPFVTDISGSRPGGVCL